MDCCTDLSSAAERIEIAFCRTLGAGWFDPDDLPEPLARVQHWGAHAMAAIRGEDVGVLYDLPRDHVWHPSA